MDKKEMLMKMISEGNFPEEVIEKLIDILGGEEHKEEEPTHEEVCGLFGGK